MGFFHRLTSKLNSQFLFFFFECILTLTAIEYHPDNNDLYRILFKKQFNHLKTLHRFSRVICKPCTRITCIIHQDKGKHLCDDGEQLFEQCTLILLNSSEKEVKIKLLHLIETARGILSNRIQLPKLEINQELN